MKASKRHQADHVLRAFRYQLLQSLDAWLALPPGGVLWLETEEDFSVLADDKRVDFQVKSSATAIGPTPHSLHSESVRAALGRYWSRSDADRDPNVFLAFMANGGAARERGLAFPNGAPGLVYWRAAALDADTAPIREALRSIFVGEPIAEWIEGNPSDTELRERLLRRVTWMLDQADVAALTELVREKIANIYHVHGLFVTAADEGLSRLLDLVFVCACEPDQQKRHLTALDLQRSIEEEALRMAAVRGAGRGTIGDVTGENINVRRLGPIGRNIIDRPGTILSVWLTSGESRYSGCMERMVSGSQFLRT